MTLSSLLNGQLRLAFGCRRQQTEGLIVLLRWLPGCRASPATLCTADGVRRGTFVTKKAHTLPVAFAMLTRVTGQAVHTSTGN